MRLISALLLSLPTLIVALSIRDDPMALVLNFVTCTEDTHSRWYSINSAFAPKIAPAAVWGQIGNFTAPTWTNWTRVTGGDNAPGSRRYYIGSSGQEEYQELVISKEDSAHATFLQVFSNSDAVGQANGVGIEFSDVLGLLAATNATEGMPGSVLTWVTAGCSNDSSSAEAFSFNKHAARFNAWLSAFNSSVA
ncbi:hypothetical protein CALCODRAFT_493583 [Calocera cornea HHB12733]|uniref:Glycoside hydrolase family 12 protein n=1 Tax=Calocera cornea HHB12733 TaxID=1353952 RepID=A0A165HL78_9BASI|nr:hypothetical protein CALCODRAFT_493583 [Calocera cornea HHB12733]